MFLVTGATGNIGRHVVAGATSSGQRVRALTRNAKVSGLASTVDVVQVDLRTSDALADGLFADVEAIFLNSDATGENTSAFLAQARSEGVRRVVTVSSCYVADNVPSSEQLGEIARMHRRNEELVESSGLAWTHLRAEEFATNAVFQIAPQLTRGDVVCGAFAHSASATVHERDIADCAVAIMLDSSDVHVGRKYVVTGPATLSERERIESMGRILGRTLRFQEIDPADARAHIVGAGVPEAVADAAIAELERRVTKPGLPTNTVSNLTGRQGLSWDQWVDDHRAAFTS